jgi:hypothetical protein
MHEKLLDLDLSCLCRHAMEVKRGLPSKVALPQLVDQAGVEPNDTPLHVLVGVRDVKISPTRHEVVQLGNGFVLVVQRGPAHKWHWCFADPCVSIFLEWCDVFHLAKKELHTVLVGDRLVARSRPRFCWCRLMLHPFQRFL